MPRSHDSATARTLSTEARTAATDADRSRARSAGGTSTIRVGCSAPKTWREAAAVDEPAQRAVEVADAVGQRVVHRPDDHRADAPGPTVSGTARTPAARDHPGDQQHRQHRDDRPDTGSSRRAGCQVTRDRNAAGHPDATSWPEHREEQHAHDRHRHLRGTVGQRPAQRLGQLRTGHRTAEEAGEGQPAEQRAVAEAADGVAQHRHQQDQVEGIRSPLLADLLSSEHDKGAGLALRDVDGADELIVPGAGATNVTVLL